MGKPGGWIAFERLEADPDTLLRLIRVRMIELIFTAENATAVRAAEMLRQLSPVVMIDDLSGYSSEALENSERWANEIIERIDREETAANGVDGSA